MRFLLDTTVLIDHAAGFPGAVETVHGLLSEPNDLLTCEVVVVEALSGGTDEERDVIGRMIDVLEYVAIPPEAARWAGAARRGAGRASPRSLGDSLVAAAARAADATLVTRNGRDFSGLGIPILDYPIP